MEGQKTVLTLPITQFIKPALYHPAKFVLTAAGRRTGKTQNHANWLSKEAFAEPELPCLWVDTTQGNIEKYVDRYFYPVLKPVWHRMKWDRFKKVLHYPNRSYIDFGSAEKPQTLEGFGYKRGVLNEAGIILRKASLWDNTIYPMLKGDDTKVRITGTPKGRGQYFKLFMQGRSDEPEWQSFQFSVYDSPYYTLDEIEFIKRNVPELVWRQEYMAEFIEGAGTVFRNIRGCIAGELQKGPRDRTAQYKMSIDLAKHEDFTVIEIADEWNQMVYFDRFNVLDWPVQKLRILEAYKHWNKPMSIIDATGVGDAIYDDLVASGMGRLTPFKFTAASKNEIIRNLIVAIENGTIKFPHIPVLVDELELFEYQARASGLFGYSAPEGFHDDAVIALAMLNELATHTPAGQASEMTVGGDINKMYGEIDELRSDGPSSDTIVIDD